MFRKDGVGREIFTDLAEAISYLSPLVDSVRDSGSWIDSGTVYITGEGWYNDRGIADGAVTFGDEN